MTVDRHPYTHHSKNHLIWSHTARKWWMTQRAIHQPIHVCREWKIKWKILSHKYAIHTCTHISFYIRIYQAMKPLPFHFIRNLENAVSNIRMQFLFFEIFYYISAYFIQLAACKFWLESSILHYQTLTRACITVCRWAHNQIIFGKCLQIVLHGVCWAKNSWIPFFVLKKTKTACFVEFL